MPTEVSSSKFRHCLICHLSCKVATIINGLTNQFRSKEIFVRMKLNQSVKLLKDSQLFCSLANTKVGLTLLLYGPTYTLSLPSHTAMK